MKHIFSLIAFYSIVCSSLNYGMARKSIIAREHLTGTTTYKSYHFDPYTHEEYTYSVVTLTFECTDRKEPFNSELSCIVWPAKSNKPNNFPLKDIYAFLTTYKNKKYGTVASTQVVDLSQADIQKLKEIYENQVATY